MKPAGKNEDFLPVKPQLPVEDRYRNQHAEDGSRQEVCLDCFKTGKDREDSWQRTCEVRTEGDKIPICCERRTKGTTVCCVW